MKGTHIPERTAGNRVYDTVRFWRRWSGFRLRHPLDGVLLRLVAVAHASSAGRCFLDHNDGVIDQDADWNKISANSDTVVSVYPHLATPKHA